MSYFHFLVESLHLKQWTLHGIILSNNFTEQKRNIIDCNRPQPVDTVWEGTGDGPFRGARTQHFSGCYGLFIFSLPPPSDQIDQSSCMVPVPSTGVAPPPCVETGQVFHPTAQVILSGADIVGPGTSSHHNMIGQTNTAAVPSLVNTYHIYWLRVFHVYHHIIPPCWVC